MRARRSPLELAIQKVSVIMGGPADWDEWIEIVKTLVLAGKVWDYVDLSKDEVPALEEPRSSQLRMSTPRHPSLDNSHARRESIEYSGRTISDSGIYMTGGTTL
jgi:hypothetical protein